MPLNDAPISGTLSKRWVSISVERLANVIFNFTLKKGVSIPMIEVLLILLVGLAYFLYDLERYKRTDAEFASASNVAKLEAVRATLFDALRYCGLPDVDEKYPPAAEVEKAFLAAHVRSAFLASGGRIAMKIVDTPPEPDEPETEAASAPEEDESLDGDADE